MEKQPVSNSKRNTGSIKQFCLLGLILAWSGVLWGQRYFSGRKEWGAVVGVSNYYGDLSQGQNWKHFHLSYGAYYKRNLSNYFAWRNQISFLEISGTTDGNPNLQFQNLNFQTKIYEYSSMLNFDFKAFGTNINNNTSTPYALIGLSGYMFDPYRLDREDVNLRVLNTENRNRNYSRLQMSVPLGLGFKVRSTHTKNRGAWIFGVEAIWRKTFMDKLDDVEGVYPDYAKMKKDRSEGSAQYSQAQTLNGQPTLAAGTYRGSSHLNDWYYFYGFNLSYRFTPLICR